MPTNTQGRQDVYEVGTLTKVGSPGRYKVFATAFSAAPVVITGLSRAGYGTRFIGIGVPAPGSFHARSSAGGSVTAQYVAFGPR